MNTKKYALIVGTLCVAVVLTKVVAALVFIGPTPRIDKMIALRLQHNVRLLFDKQAKENDKKVKKLIEIANTTPATQLVAPGVKAEATEYGTFIQIDSTGIRYEVHSYLINGKVIKIKVPVGVTPPTQSEAEAIMQE